MLLKCTKIDNWIPRNHGPSCGEIVTLTDVTEEGYLIFQEYPEHYAYNPDYFVEHDPDIALAVLQDDDDCFGTAVGQNSARLCYV